MADVWHQADCDKIEAIQRRKELNMYWPRPDEYIVEGEIMISDGKSLRPKIPYNDSRYDLPYGIPIPSEKFFIIDGIEI